MLGYVFIAAVLLGLCTYLVSKWLRHKYPEAYARRSLVVSKYVCVVGFIFLGFEGVVVEMEPNGTLLLGFSAFFGTVYLLIIWRGSLDVNRLSGSEVILFITLFAIGLGLRVLFHGG